MSKIIKTDDFPVKNGPPVKKWVLVAVVLVLVAVIGLGLFFWKKSDDASSGKVRLSRVCSEELIVRASDKIKASDLAATQAITEEIKKIKTYENDTNCMFILIRYAMMRSDATEAKLLLDQLREVYIPYHKAFTVTTFTPDELAGFIKEIEETNKIKLNEAEKRNEQQAEQDSAADAWVNGGVN